MNRQRYAFHLAYEGTHYRGWQYQPNVRSVAQTIQEALAKVLRLPKVTIVGCGRTDAGVHASQYVFHSDLAPLADVVQFRYRLNKTLPTDIAIYDIFAVEPSFHARFSAQWRHYHYLIHLQKNPFLEAGSMPYHDRPLHLDRMHQAVALLSQYEDYAGLCRQPHLHNTTICRVREAQLFPSADGTRLQLHLCANRFLRGQIRIIVRKLLELSEGKLSLDQFEHILTSGQRPDLLLPAPPQGLYLSGVEYEGLPLPSNPPAIFLKP